MSFRPRIDEPTPLRDRIAAVAPTAPEPQRRAPRGLWERFAAWVLR